MPSGRQRRMPRWTRPRLLWAQLTGSLWFVPATMVIGAAILAILMVEVSSRVDRETLARWPRLFGASAQSSRNMLGAIAGAMMTVAGVTFSITVLAVAQASSQYTPRILRNFMRDRPNQITLGTLTGVFVYCLVVMRTIRGADELRFIPAVAVVLAIVLAIVAIGVLIYFIHHSAESLEASHILARVREDTISAIDRLFPQDVGEPAEPPAGSVPGDGAWRAVHGQATGYIAHVDADGLLDWSVSVDAVVRLERAVGDHVVRGTPILSVAGPAALDDGAADLLNGFFEVAPIRTVDQDPVFGLRQMVDIAVKALSPGVNDTTTAIASIDALGAALFRMAGRGDEPAYRVVDGRLRLIVRHATFAALTAVAVDEIRRTAAGNVNVLGRLLTMLMLVAGGTRSPARHAVILDHGRRIRDAAERLVPDAADRAGILERYRQLRAALVVSEGQ
jgi:uncharacterized membrane protein